jgi:hypothetical protein
MEEESQKQYLYTVGFLLVGLFRSIPGVLGLSGERFTFETAADDRVLIDTTLAEMKDLTFPWYYFGGGMKFRVGSNKYRFSFAAQAQVRDDADGVDESIQSIIAARKAGKAWKAKLCGRELPVTQRFER